VIWSEVLSYREEGLTGEAGLRPGGAGLGRPQGATGGGASWRGGGGGTAQDPGMRFSPRFMAIIAKTVNPCHEIL